MTLVVTRIYTRIEIRRNEHQEEKSVLLHATRFLKGKGPKLALPKTQRNDPSRSLLTFGHSGPTAGLPSIWFYLVELAFAFECHGGAPRPHTVFHTLARTSY